MKKLLILAILISLSYVSLSQTTPEEKVAASPDTEDIELINKLMKVSKFDNYFKVYCSKQIDSIGKVNKWDVQKIEAQKNKVNFSDFMDDTIYNTFSIYAKKNLNDLINYCQTSPNPDNLPLMILKDSQISNNLPLFVKRYLK